MLSAALALLAICATIQVSPIVAASWSTSLAIKLTWSTSGMVHHKPSGFCTAIYSSANAVTHYERKVCDSTSQSRTYTYRDSDCTAHDSVVTVVSLPQTVGTMTMNCVEIGTWSDPAITSLKNFRNDACANWTQCKEDHFLANYCNVFTSAVVISGTSYLSSRYSSTGYGSTTYTDDACTSGPRPAVTGTAASCGSRTDKCQDGSTLATEAYSVVTANTDAPLPGNSASSDDSSGFEIWKLIVGIGLAGTLVSGMTVTAVLWAGAKPLVDVALEKEKERSARMALDTEIESTPLSHKQCVPIAAEVQTPPAQTKQESSQEESSDPDEESDEESQDYLPLEAQTPPSDSPVGDIKIDLPLEVQTPPAQTKQESSQEESSDPDDESDEESQDSDEMSEKHL